jgi:cobalt-zinc-cadmium efflux system membrane fusion protein
MRMASSIQRPPSDEDNGPTIPTPVSSEPPSEAGAAPRKMGFGQRIVVANLFLVVLIPPAAGFFSYFSGVPPHLLASTMVAKASSSSPPSVSLVPGHAHTVDVPDEIAIDLGIRHGNQDSVAVAKVPETMQPFVLAGSTALDPPRLARIRARFAPRPVQK